MSGRGHKQPNRTGARPSQPSSKKGSAAGRTTKARGGSRRSSRASAEAARQALAARRRRNRRIGVLIGALAIAGAIVGAVILGQRDGSTAAAQDADATSTSPSAARPTAGPTMASAPATSTEASAMVITCPTGGGASTQFGHEIVLPPPYTVTIDYGDGDEYTNDSAHLDAIFSHTYEEPGTYAVNAVLTIPGVATAAANCTYTWGP